MKWAIIMSRLAIDGGAPVRLNKLPYGRQHIDEDDIAAVIKTLKSDYLTTGPTVAEFESCVAEYVGSKYAVAFSNGTAALHGAAFAAGLREGDQAIVSSMTFAASANCIRYCDATPVFADINPNTWNIDINSINSLITSKTKAIIAVDYTGQPVDIDSIMEIAKKNELIVIEDGAHALGSLYKGEPVGNRADMTMFSFHPVKPITTGEGGVITTNSFDLYRKLLLFRTHGISRDIELMSENHGSWYYEQLFLGFNYRMNDIQAALGISQMKKLNHFISRRREIANQYKIAFQNSRFVNIQMEPDYSESGYHLFIIELNLDTLSVDRRQIFKALQAENIGVNVHYIPVYYHPYYQNLGYEKGTCPNSEKFYEKIISLPIFPSMTDQDVQSVITAVEKVLHAYKK